MPAVKVCNCLEDVQWNMDVLTGNQKVRLQKELSAVCTAAGSTCKPDDMVIEYRSRHQCSNGSPIRVHITWKEGEQERLGARLEKLIHDCVVRFIPHQEVEVLTEHPAATAVPSPAGA